MFESDDWTFEDAFDDIDEKALQSHSLCQSEEEPSSIKRRKIDSCKFSSSVANNTFEFELDAVANTVNNNSSANSSKSNVSRGNLLLGIFQENASNRETTDLTKETNENPSNLPKEVPSFKTKKTNEIKSITSHYKESKGKNIKSTSKIESVKEVKLVRIFPGPAGLIPDTKNDNVPATSEQYLNNAIELENKITKHIETNLPKSQDERNLYDEQAWKLLLDDLPNDFFKEYGIFTTKSRANANNCDSMKVKFVAGVIDYIDNSHDDPLIILKDSTGSIEGTVHRDITLNYPGVLEPNVVLLLHDVGLLKTVTYVVTNKYHILVSRTNLLAVYSSKGRIVSTSRMEDILSNISSEFENGDQCTPISGHCTSNWLQQTNAADNENCDNTFLPTTSSTSIPTNIPTNDRKSTSEPSTKCSKQITEKNTENSKIAAESIFEDVNYSTSMDDLDMNDIFFAVDCEFTSSTEQNCPDRSSSETVPRTGDIQRCESQAQRTNHLENTRKESVIHFENRNKNKTQNLSETLQERVANVTLIDTHQRSFCENRLSSHDNRTHAVKKDSNLNAKSASPTVKHNAEDTKKNLLNYFTSDNNKYDSDDEFLSQLDIDNI